MMRWSPLPRHAVALESIVATLFLLLTSGYAVSSEDVIVLTVDPNSVDQQGCGSSATPCASVLGALVYNNLTSSDHNTSYGLLLQTGVYSGLDNRNISLPANIAWINGNNTNGPVVFENTVFNMTTVVNSTYSYNTTTVTPIFNVSSSLTISGVTFSGTFGYNGFNTYAIAITDGNGTVTSSVFSFINVSFTPLVSYIYGGAACINAVLAEGSQLVLQGVTTNALKLVSISSWVSSENICPPINYKFPLLSITALNVNGVNPIEYYYYYSQTLISTSNVDLLLRNITISNSTIGLISSVSDAGCFNTSMPMTTVHNLSVQNSSLAGGVFAAIAEISDVSVTNCQISDLGVLYFYWGSATDVSISDNSYIPVSSFDIKVSTRRIETHIRIC